MQRFSEVPVKVSPSETGQVHSKRKLSQRLLCLNRNTFLLLTYFSDWIFTAHSKWLVSVIICVNTRPPGFEV